IYRAEHGTDEPVVHARRSVESEEQRPAGGVWMTAVGAVALVAVVVWLLRDPFENRPADEAAVFGVEAEMIEPERAGNSAPGLLPAARPSAAVVPAGRSGATVDAVSTFTVGAPVSGS